MYEGEKVRLRAVQTADLDLLMSYVNNYATRRTLGFVLPVSESFERKWVERAGSVDPFRDGSVHFIIEDKETLEFLGTGGLLGVDPRSRRAELGIAIWNSSKQGQGFGTDATNLLLWVGFHLLNLHSVFLRVLAINEAGQAVYRKIGFREQGRYREAVFLEGDYHDLIYMDILGREFFESYPPGLPKFLSDGEN